MLNPDARGGDLSLAADVVCHRDMIVELSGRETDFGIGVRCRSVGNQVGARRRGAEAIAGRVSGGRIAVATEASQRRFAVNAIHKRVVAESGNEMRHIAHQPRGAFSSKPLIKFPIPNNPMIFASFY